MEILSQDKQLSNESPQKPLNSDIAKSMPKPPAPAKKVRKLPRRQMIADIKEYKSELGQSKNFKKGSAYNLANLFIKLANLNFTIMNMRSLTDEEVFAIWNDITQSK